MRRSDSLLMALFLMAPPASAEIFKCMETNGLIRLQNFPCSIDSIGSAATAGSGASAISSNPTPRAHTLKAVIPTGEEPNGEEPYVGMTMDEVRGRWGDPKSVKQINGIEIWYFDGPGDSTRGVRFDRAGKVQGIGDEDWQPDSNAS